MYLDTKNTNDIAAAQGLMSPVAMSANALPIGAEQIRKFMQILQKYKAGKAMTEKRVVSSENWWKLRNAVEERKTTSISADGGFQSASGWLHNVIVSKHADALQNYPEPNILPREEGDKAEAQLLSDIVPCVLEQNYFEKTYSDVAWSKLKSGTGVYKVVWDASKLGGLGDIALEEVNLLNIYWEPGVTDIQRSRYVFHTELMDKDILEELYPQVKGKLCGNSFMSTTFLYDDHVDTANKHTVVEVYYHKRVGGRNTLQYCRFVGEHVLYATENEPETAQRGLYDHGKFPFVFDTLFPIAGSPCGYGFVDLCRNPQTVIDLLNTAFVKNAMVGATPRYFVRQDGAVNEEEFLDLSKPIVHVNGSLNDEFLRRVEHTPLDSMYAEVLDRTVNELRQTSGNTETSTGTSNSGVTAASAIAALQEASGKGSRDSTLSSYRAYMQIVELCIELIRQFYDTPRQFRIAGESGAQQFISYTNAGIQPQHQGNAFGEDMGYRLPVFDIKVSAQLRNVYTKITQNELALQFFQLGFFNPQMCEQAVMCMEMMEFEGKDALIAKILRNGGTNQKLLQYMQLALSLAQSAQPQLVQQIAQDLAATMQACGGAVSGADGGLAQADMLGSLATKEHSRVEEARKRANAAAQP